MRKNLIFLSLCLSAITANAQISAIRLEADCSDTKCVVRNHYNSELYCTTQLKVGFHSNSLGNKVVEESDTVIIPANAAYIISPITRSLPDMKLSYLSASATCYSPYR